MHPQIFETGTDQSSHHIDILDTLAALALGGMIKLHDYDCIFLINLDIDGELKL